MKISEKIISVDPLVSAVVSDVDSAADVELRCLRVDASLHGMRLDRAVVALVPEFSRSYLQQIIAGGGVTLNEQVVTKAATRVKVSDQGAIELRPTPQCQAFKAEAPDLDIVYQDEHLLVINKPAGLVVHPAPGNWSGTLMNRLLGLDEQAFNLPRAGIVHRLDKDTSGLMVVARTRSSMDALVHAIAQRSVKRHYLALAHRPWLGARQRHVDAPIGRDPVHRLRMAVVDLAVHPGKTAQTDFECLMNAAQGCLVWCRLHTGRTHQIRVHLASIGHPLVADTLYGGAPVAAMQRQALHATRLSFVHPVTGIDLCFESPPPPDFAQALAQWGLAYNGAHR